MRMEACGVLGIMWIGAKALAPRNYYLSTIDASDPLMEKLGGELTCLRAERPRLVS